MTNIVVHSSFYIMHAVLYLAVVLLCFITFRSWRAVLVALIPLGVLLFFGIVGNLVQHMPVLSVDPIKPKLSKISPIQGFKRLFSTEALVNFAKGLIKISVVSAVMWFVVTPYFRQCGPPAFSATLPPSVHALCELGSGAKYRPKGAARRDSSALITPGWTVAVRESGTSGAG